MSQEGVEVPGLHAPVRRALTERMMICGVPHKMLGALLCTVGLFVFGLKLWWFLALVPALYGLAVWGYRKDPYFLEIWVQSRGPNSFEP